LILRHFEKHSVVKPDASGNLTVVYAFPGGFDAGYPNAAIVLDAAGKIYGTSRQPVSARRTPGLIRIGLQDRPNGNRNSAL